MKKTITILEFILLLAMLFFLLTLASYSIDGKTLRGGSHSTKQI